MQPVLEIDGLHVTNPDGSASDLFPYQKKDLLEAFSAPKNDSCQAMFFNLGTGCGKTVIAAAGAQELFNRGEIDLAIMFTLPKVKPGFIAIGNKFTNLRFKTVEGAKASRRKKYVKQDYDVLVLNYEKARQKVDLQEILPLVAEKRVLFCFDEAQAILLPNTSRDGILELIEAASFSYIWSMSASIINGDPERFWRVFEFAPYNPLGTLLEFRERYVDHVEKMKMRNKGPSAKWVPYINLEKTIWDTEALSDVPERVKGFMVTGRKTDPGIREFFKGLQFKAVPLEMAPKQKKLYDIIYTGYRNAVEDGDLIQFYNALRLTCLHPSATIYSEGRVSKTIVDTIGKDTLLKIEDNKLDRLIEDVQTLLDGGDKIVVFSHYVNMSINIIEQAFQKHKIPYVVNKGGLSNKETERIQDEFKESREPMVFLSSDAGSHGINLPQARVVINYDLPNSYDTLMQRNDRIDRADSWLDGLEAWSYYYDVPLEQKMWARNNDRRLMSSNLQGTSEVLGANGSDEMSAAEIRQLLG